MGRRKIPMEKQEIESQRHITFSKRRKGLYNKAAQLCMSFDCQIAILVSAPSANSYFYSLAYPSIDAIVDAFTTGSSLIMVEDDAKQAMRSQYLEIKEVEQKLAIEQAKLKKKNSGLWWECEDFESWNSVEKLESFMDALKGLKENVTNRLNGDCGVTEPLIFADSGFNIDEILTSPEYIDDLAQPTCVPNMASITSSFMDGDCGVTQPSIFDDSRFNIDELNEFWASLQHTDDFVQPTCVPDMVSTTSSFMNDMVSTTSGFMNGDYGVTQSELNEFRTSPEHTDDIVQPTYEFRTSPEHTDDIVQPTCVPNMISTTSSFDGSIGDPVMDKFEEDLLYFLA